MATLTLGDQRIPLNRSADLDDRLLALTGHKGAELAPLLASPTISLLAAVISALSPKDRSVSRFVVGALLAEADLAEATAQVLPLLAPRSDEPNERDGGNGSE